MYRWGVLCSLEAVCILTWWSLFFRFGGAPRFGGNRNGGSSGKYGNPGERLIKKKWNLETLPKFEKNFYQEHPDLVRRTPVRLLGVMGTPLHIAAWSRTPALKCLRSRSPIEEPCPEGYLWGGRYLGVTGVHFQSDVFGEMGIQKTHQLDYGALKAQLASVHFETSCEVSRFSSGVVIQGSGLGWGL